MLYFRFCVAKKSIKKNPKVISSCMIFGFKKTKLNWCVPNDLFGGKMKFCLNDFLELNTNELLTVNGGYYCNGSSPSTQGYVATCMPSFKTSMGYYYGNNISLGGNCGIVNISFPV